MWNCFDITPFILPFAFSAIFRHRECSEVPLEFHTSILKIGNRSRVRSRLIHGGECRRSSHWSNHVSFLDVVSGARVAWYDRHLKFNVCQAHAYCNGGGGDPPHSCQSADLCSLFRCHGCVSPFARSHARLHGDLRDLYELCDTHPAGILVNTS